MNNPRRIGASLVAVAAVALVAAASNWTTMVQRNAAWHTVGNPDAEITVADFSSYTCPHCGTYARTGGEVMKLAYVGSGKARVEMRHVIRNPVDLTAALAAWCGDDDKFLRNHAALMFAQDDWMEKLESATPAQRQRWSTGPIPARLRAIASDLDFYQIFEQRGYDRPTLDQCLADTARMDALIGATMADAETFGVRGTPSFAIDGTLLEGVHHWDTLKPRLDAALNVPAPDTADTERDDAFSLE